MMAVYGRVQREGDVVHLIAHRLTDLSAELASVGERDVAFPVPQGGGDHAKTGGGPDPSETLGRRSTEIHILDYQTDQIKVKTRDFR
jgi:error-prone DNA polymerase